MVKQDADEYAVETLRNLKIELEKILNQVTNGIRALERDNIPDKKNQESSQPLTGYKEISKTSSK